MAKMKTGAPKRLPFVPPVAQKGSGKKLPFPPKGGTKPPKAAKTERGNC